MKYFVSRCIISSFYIKPQPTQQGQELGNGCIISSFYIKPQQVAQLRLTLGVVLYLHSTSNHNRSNPACNHDTVVLYLHSTSNHNNYNGEEITDQVVLYLHSTSNHNS